MPDEETDEVCELCGRKMVIKSGRYGKFLACPGFPECKNTKRLVKDTGGLCPKCGSRMLVRHSKKGRVYYGCEKNPDLRLYDMERAHHRKMPGVRFHPVQKGRKERYPAVRKRGLRLLPRAGCRKKRSKSMHIRVLGAGLAGCEAALYLAGRGYAVELWEQKPHKFSPAHKNADFAELVCSNSLRSDSLNNAVGILKEEMRHLDSIIMESAKATRVPAGSALAVDRQAFSRRITEQLKQHPLIEVVQEEVTQIPDGPCIIASGPLTSDALSKAIQEYTHADYFHFYDAAAPIIEKDSIDFSKAYIKSRYDKGEAAYINCAMSREEFDAFYEELIHAETAQLHEFEDETYFEGCMPFEEMARRGRQTLLFGPMKPVGLERPDGTTPYAVVQLRQDNEEDTMYNIVGFQTHLKWGSRNGFLA